MARSGCATKDSVLPHETTTSNVSSRQGSAARSPCRKPAPGEPAPRHAEQPRRDVHAVRLVAELQQDGRLKARSTAGVERPRAPGSGRRRELGAQEVVQHVVEVLVPGLEIVVGCGHRVEDRPHPGRHGASVAKRGRLGTRGSPCASGAGMLRTDGEPPGRAARRAGSRRRMARAGPVRRPWMAGVMAGRLGPSPRVASRAPPEAARAGDGRRRPAGPWGNSSGACASPPSRAGGSGRPSRPGSG